MTGHPGDVFGLELHDVERFFGLRLPEFPQPLSFRLFAGGRSNLTYHVSAADGSACVLRRPPLGTIAPSAHDMGREHRVIRALVKVDPTFPTPRPLAFEASGVTGGVPLLVVEFVEGESLDSAAAGARLDPAVASSATDALLAVLARIHSVDLDAAGLADLARHGGYLERQVQRWRSQWDLVSGRDLRDLEQLYQQLLDRVPRDSATALVHGDFRFDNTIHAPGDPSTILAIIDWEMATLGDPLADLGLLAAYWTEEAAPLLRDGNPVTANAGFPSADDVVERYLRLRSLTPNDLAFYIALGFFKLAVIAEGIHSRFLAGGTFGEGFEDLDAAVLPLVAAGLRHLC